MKKTTLLKATVKAAGKSFALLATLGLILTGCTKKTPYEGLKNKEEDEVKATIMSANSKQSDEYLYVASTANSSRSSDVARPYWQGEEKIVKFQFTDKTLDVIEIEKENRFAQNSTNSKLVLTIPVEHIEYSCAKNSSGECTNKEEKNIEIHWSKRSKFKADFSGIKVTEKSMLPIELENLFNQGCYAPTADKLIGYEMKADKINILMEKTFTINVNCANAIEKLSDLTISQVYHYSFAKISKLASADFKPVLYPQTDENTFGFFTTEYTKLDIDNNSTEKDKVVLMNHWNPNRKVITYYLSPEFAKTGNAQIKNATELSVQRINDSLTKAGVDLRIDLKQGDGSQLSGDITNSMIVLVEDPSAAGVLGYGPSVANPRTGEILSGRVVMYKGILETYIKYTYEEIRRGELAKLENAATKKLIPISAASYLIRPIQTAAAEKAAKPAGQAAVKSKGPALPSQSSAVLAKGKDAIVKSLRNYTQNVKAIKKDNVLESGKDCYFTTEAISVDKKVSADVIEVMGDDLTAWEDLSTGEKKQVLDILMPVAWIPTLVHELGHNLGLRHNFSGSEDKANYFSKEELAVSGVEHDIPYSSVMDYGASELNLLPTMGNYDVAALRYGYNRQVETNKGEIVQLTSSLESFKAASATAKTELKDYMYCTDENVGANAGCKRFDAGTSYVEIAQHLIKDYEEKYYLRNFRNQRLSFSLMSDLTYADRISYTFDNLRTFFEVRERLKNEFNLVDSAPEWSEIAWLKDLNDAVTISGDFFIKVLTTPELTCAVAQATTPDQIQFLIPIDGLSKRSANCYEAEINPAYTVVGQFGKSFQSRKSALSTNAYIDQIDVRGTWIDKVLAAKYIFARKTGSFNFDKYADNYTDIPEFKEKLIKASNEIALNKATTEVTVRDESGMPLISGVVNVDTFKTHVIPELVSPYISKAMGVPTTESYFTESYLKTIRDDMLSVPSAALKSREMVDLFTVRQLSDLSTIDQSTLKSALQIDIGNKKYLANVEKNQLAAVLIQTAHVGAVVGSLEIQEILDVIAAREKGEVAPQGPKMNEALMAAWTLDINLLKQFVDLGLTYEELQELIQIMPAS